MITLTFTFNTTEEAMVALAQVEGGKRLLANPEPLQPGDYEEEQPLVAAQEPKKRASRKKAEVVPEAKEPTKSLENPVDNLVVSLTIDDARDALQRVIDTCGHDAAAKFINDFGYKRLPEVPSEKYASFILAADARVAE